MNPAPLGWLGIARLGLVQMSLGAIVVLMTSTLNRVMVVELALPSVLPATLIGLHYAIQVLRPRWGYGSDVGGRLTPWIIGGMAVLALGAIAATLSTLFIVEHRILGIAFAAAAFTAIGVGVGASGTSLLVLLAKQTAPARRAPAATIVWIMMIFGFAATAGTAGHFLDPYSSMRLVTVTAVVGGLAVIVTTLALLGIEHAPGTVPASATDQTPGHAAKPPFRQALAEVWAEPSARRFTIFIFVSMIAYSAQELILEPFAGLVYQLTPGQSTKLSGLQHSGVLLGMLLVAVAGVRSGADRSALGAWAVGGCLASAAALMAIAFGALAYPEWPFRTTVFILGVANGAFAIAAIGSMMARVGEGQRSREGVRMGLWGAAQGVAFGLGGFAGALAVDIARTLLPTPQTAYGVVFILEALVFVYSAVLAAEISRGASSASQPSRPHAPVRRLIFQLATAQGAHAHD